MKNNDRAKLKKTVDTVLKTPTDETLPDGPRRGRRDPERFAVKITGATKLSAYWEYTIKQVDKLDHSTQAIDNTVTSKGYDYAELDLTAAKSSPIPVNTVLMADLYYSEANGAEFWFSYGGDLPKGQYRGMILQMVTDNQVGYDYLCSHAME